MNNIFANNNTPNIFANSNNNNNNNNNNSSNNNIFNRGNQNIFQSQNNGGNQYNNNNNNNNNQGGGYYQQSQNIFQSNNNMNNNNNIFANNNGNNNVGMNNNTNNNNIFNTNNNNRNNNQNVVQNLGTYRGKYELVKSSHTENQSNSSITIMNTSIIFCKGYESLNPLLLRLEDYFLIRSQNINDNDKQKVNGAIQINSFNASLFNLPQNFQPPNTGALFQDIRLVQSQYVGGANNNIAMNNNTNNNIFNNNNGNNNGNIFNQNNNNNNNSNNNNNNIFSVNRNQSNNNNIFSNNNGGNNIFNNNNNQNGNNNNIFNNNNANNNNGGNIFNNNNNNMNRSNNNTNIFQNSNNNGGNNNGGNIFQNNNNGGMNNNNNGGNIFQQNGNNSQNIFNNNNNNNNNQSIFRNQSTNIFNNNGGNTGNNNIFANNNNNNNQSIFRNNNNNNTNIFANNNNNNNNNASLNIFQRNNQSIFNNNNNNNVPNNSIFNNNNNNGNIFANNNNQNIFANNNNNNMYNNGMYSQMPGGQNGYYSIQSGMYYAPSYPTNEYTLEQYKEMKEQEAEDRKKITQSYFMPTMCPEVYAPAFKSKPIIKPIYVTLPQEKSFKSFANSMIPLINNNEKLKKSQSQRGQSSDGYQMKTIDSYSMTQSAIKEKKNREEFYFYKQPAQQLKQREISMRQQLSQLKPLIIKVEAQCNKLDGEDEEVILENQIDTHSQVKHIGLFCVDQLVKSGRFQEPSRPYFFQIYYERELIVNQEQLIVDAMDTQYGSIKCSVIFEYDRRPFMKNSDYEVIPSLEDLQKLPINDLRKVDNFSIEGYYGKLEWEGPVDLIDLDIDKTVIIGDQMIIVYPDVELGSALEKPKVGEKLNKKCYITYKNASAIIRKISSGELNLNNIVKSIKKQCEIQGVQFVSFNEAELTWTIVVEHFSGYGFNLEEEDDEGQAQNNNTPMNQQQNQMIPPSSSQPINQPQFANQFTNQTQFNQGNFQPQQQYQQSIQQNQNQYYQNLQNQLPIQQQQFKIQVTAPEQESETQINGNDKGQMQNEIKQNINNNQNYMQFQNQNNFQNQPISQQFQNQQNQSQQRKYSPTQQNQYYYSGQDIIPEEVENGSYNNTQQEIDNQNYQQQYNNNTKISYLPPPKQANYFQKNQTTQQDQDEDNDFIQRAQGLNNFNLFKQIVQKGKNRIQSKMQAGGKKNNNLLKSLKEHELVARGLQTLNQHLFQHSLDESTFKGNKFYQDFSFSPSWNQNTFVSYSASSNTIRKHTFQDNYIGRIQASSKEMVESYNKVVINGFIQSIVESQSQDILNKLNDIMKNNDENSMISDNLLWDTLPQISIPINNSYTLFLIIYFKNHLLPALNIAQNNLSTQKDLYTVLMEELIILSLINVLYGNPQVDIISILKKINSNNFSEHQWKKLIEGLRNSNINLRDDVIQNLRKRQMKKLLEYKFQKDIELNEIQEEYIGNIGNRQVQGEQDIEQLILDCLKSHQINKAIQIANYHKLTTLSHLLTSFELGNSQVLLKSIDPNNVDHFPRIISFLTGNLSEIYAQNNNPRQSSPLSSISLLNKFACELWYHKDQNQSLAAIFNSFISKINDSIYDANEKEKATSLEILLIAQYAQQELSEEFSSEKLKNIKLFVNIQSSCYSSSKLDKRLSWFVIEFVNKYYFVDNLLSDKRVRLMRGFIQQLSFQKKWQYEIVILCMMKDILPKGQFISTVRNIFLKNCIPKGNKSIKIPNSSQGNSSGNNNSYLQNNQAAPASFAVSMNSFDGFAAAPDSIFIQDKRQNYDSFDDSPSVKNILHLFYLKYSREAQGLYHYNYHSYQRALYHLMKQQNQPNYEICNKIISYYEGPRIYLFGNQAEREDMQNYLSLISKKAGKISKYRIQSGLIKDVFSILLGEQIELHKPEFINRIINLKELLVLSQNVKNSVDYPHYYDIIQENQEKPSLNRRLFDKKHQATMRIDNGGMLYQEFISFIFLQLAEKVPDIRRYCKHMQTTNDVQQLLDIVSQNKAPKNEQIKDLILSTLPPMKQF